MALLMFSLAQQSVGEDDRSKVAEIVQPSLVIVLAYTEGSVSQGSGFFIDRNGAIITSLHVINSSKNYKVKTADGKVYPIKKVLSRDLGSDLACMQADIPSGSVLPIPISNKLPRLGEQVLVGGCPLGVGIIMSSGIISGFTYMPGYGRTILTDAPISSGSSGGPVLNMKGEVVGVITFSSTKGQNLNFAMPCDRVDDILIELNRKLNEGNNLTPVDGIYLEGLDLIRDNNYVDALPYFEEVLRIDPRFTDAYIYAGFCDNEMEKYEKAVGYSDTAISIDPTNADAWNNKGFALFSMGSYNESINCSEKAIEIDENYAEAWNNKGAALYGMGIFTEALECFNRSLQLDPYLAKAWNNKGKSFTALGKYSYSLKYFDEAIKTNPKFAIACNNKGYALYRMGRYNESIQCYDAATEINPLYALAWNNKGNAFRAIGMLNESWKSFEKAIEIDPSYAKPWKKKP